MTDSASDNGDAVVDGLGNRSECAIRTDGAEPDTKIEFCRTFWDTQHVSRKRVKRL